MVTMYYAVMMYICSQNLSDLKPAAAAVATGCCGVTTMKNLKGIFVPTKTAMIISN